IRHPAGADSFDRGAEDRIMSHQISARARVSFGRERSWRRGGGRGLNAQAGLGAEARTFFWRAKAGLPAEARARVVRAKVGHFIEAVSVTRARISITPLSIGVGAAGASARAMVIIGRG